MKIQYFGTDTKQCGHYFWDFSDNGERMRTSDLYFENIPFNPEDYPPKISRYESSPKGTTHYDVVEGWTIFAISGSPFDKRGGCKCVFFINEPLIMSEIIEKIKSIPAAMGLIEKLPFDVKEFNHINQT